MTSYSQLCVKEHANHVPRKMHFSVARLAPQAQSAQNRWLFPGVSATKKKIQFLHGRIRPQATSFPCIVSISKNSAFSVAGSCEVAADFGVADRGGCCVMVRGGESCFVPSSVRGSYGGTGCRLAGCNSFTPSFFGFFARMSLGGYVG